MPRVLRISRSLYVKDNMQQLLIINNNLLLEVVVGFPCQRIFPTLPNVSYFVYKELNSNQEAHSSVIILPRWIVCKLFLVLSIAELLST